MSKLAGFAFVAVLALSGAAFAEDETAVPTPPDAMTTQQQPDSQAAAPPAGPAVAVPPSFSTLGGGLGTKDVNWVEAGNDKQ